MLFFVLALIFCCRLDAFKIDSVEVKTHEPDLAVHETVDSFFHKERFYLQDSYIRTDPIRLQQAAKDALLFLSTHPEKKQSIINPASFQDLVSLEDTKNTLRFIINTIEHDKKTGHFRILNQHFLNKHFKAVTWNADKKGAQEHSIHLPDNGNIRLTCYAIFQGNASYKKTAQTPCALYKITNKAIAHKFTKQQVLAGALEKKEYQNAVTPLAWVSRQTLEDALMQGTIVVTFPDGKQQVLGVAVNNGIAYNRSEKNVLAQKRYWFFAPVKGTCKHPNRTVKKIRQRKHVIFAGDIHHIGIGKVIALKHTNPINGKDELRLGILADTGGAFQNNLYQLDYFLGITANKEVLKKELAQLPPTSRAFVLYKPRA